MADSGHREAAEPSEETEDRPDAAVPLTGRSAPDGVVRPAWASRLLASYRPHSPRDRLAARIRTLADPAAVPGQAPATETALPHQPIVIEHLPGPLRQRVVEALAARSRALAMVSVQRSLLAAGLPLILGAVLSLGLVWYCLHQISPTFLDDPARQVVLPLVLAGLVPPLAAVVVYSLSRLFHHRAIRNNQRLAGPLAGLAGLIVLAAVLAGIMRPWSFPDPATRPVPFSTVQFALSTGGYRVLTFGVVPTQPFGTRTAVYVQSPLGPWVVTPVHEPMAASFVHQLRHARAAPAAAATQAVAGNQLSALRQRTDLLDGLAVFSLVAAAALTVLQLWRWRRAAAARVPEGALRALVNSLQTSGTLPAGWMLGEPALDRRPTGHASFD